MGVLGPIALEFITETGCAIPMFNHVMLDGRKMAPHRGIWALVHGALLPRQQVIRICGNPRCVRLDHLVLRRDRCQRGHLFDAKNTWTSSRRPGMRQCKKCVALRARRRRERERAKAA